MRDDYTRLVEIANQGAKELGYADTGAMWRSQYDMSPQEFSAMYERLWSEVKPLYDELHCYMRTKLNQKYGDEVQPATGPIRADLLGNMWAQEWGNIYDVVAPKGAGDVGYDVTELLEGQEEDPDRHGQDRRGLLHLARPRSRCRRPSASAARSSAPRAAKSSATRRPGTSTTRTICASRCAPRSTATTSSPSTTSSATIITSAPTTSSPTSI